MGGDSLSNISLKKFRNFLKQQGLSCKEGKGDHEKWVRSDLWRPLILQTKVKTVPPHIIRENIKTLGMSKEEFLDKIREFK